MSKIERYLPNNQYQAAMNANSPSAANPFLTSADLPPGSVKYYGSFYDTITQTLTAGSTAAMRLNTTDATCTNGFTVENNLSGVPTRIKAAHTGVYNLQFSAQLDRTSGGNSQQVDIWININGNPVPYTTTGVTIQANAGKLVTAWNFFVKLNAGDFVEIMWTQGDNIQILAAPSTPTFPATPSVIATINQVS